MARPRNPKKPQPEWARRLEAARIMTGLNVKQFAGKLGLSGDRDAERYAKYERGEREPNIQMWIKIHLELNVSLDFLLTGDPKSRLESRS